jgi:hypothetical protein
MNQRFGGTYHVHIQGRKSAEYMWSPFKFVYNIHNNLPMKADTGSVKLLQSLMNVTKHWGPK